MNNVIKVDFRNRCRVVERTITHEDTIFQQIADVTRCIEQTEDPDYILELELKLNELYEQAANKYDMVAEVEL